MSDIFHQPGLIYDMGHACGPGYPLQGPVSGGLYQLAPLRRAPEGLSTPIPMAKKSPVKKKKPPNNPKK